MLYTFKDPLGHEHLVDMDDKRFRIRPYQQILSSCTGALFTSVMSKFTFKLHLAKRRD